jgi:hypothetical protein
LNFRRLNGRKDIREGRFNVEEEEAGDGGHDRRHSETVDGGSEISLENERREEC